MNEVIPSSNLKENYQGTMAAAWERILCWITMRRRFWKINSASCELKNVNVPIAYNFYSMFEKEHAIDGL